MSRSPETSIPAPSFETAPQDAGIMRPDQPVTLTPDHHLEIVRNAHSLFDSHLQFGIDVLAKTKEQHANITDALKLMLHPDTQAELKLQTEDLVKIYTSPALLWGIGVERSTDAQHALFIPGMGGSDTFFYPLAQLMRQHMGVTTHFAGITEQKGWKDDINRVDQATQRLYEQTKKPIVVIGHSMGGAVGKAVAHREDQRFLLGDIDERRIKKLILLASPGDTDNPISSEAAGQMAYQHQMKDPNGDMGQELFTSMSTSLSRGIDLTAMFTYNDPVVKEEAGIASVTQHATNYEIERASHGLFPYNPEVFILLAKELAMNN